MIDRNQQHEDMIRFIKNILTTSMHGWNAETDLPQLQARFPDADFEDIADALEDAAIRLAAEAEELREYRRIRNAT